MRSRRDKHYRNLWQPAVAGMVLISIISIMALTAMSSSAAQVDAAAPYVEYVMFSSNIGPGTARDPEYASVVWEAQAAGIKVLGYIFTDLARRDLATLQQEVRTDADWYAVDGIHIDGAQDDPEFIPYFRELAETIREEGPDGRDGIVWLNPGYVFVTDQFETEHYQTLPTFWSAKLDLLCS